MNSCDEPSLRVLTNAELERAAAEAGRITWHSSGEDEGPDVGLELGLGDGWTLYVGELTDETVRCAGIDLGEHNASWWLTLCSDEEGFQIVGPVANAEAGRALVDRLFAAIQGARKDGSSPQISDPSNAK